MIDCCLDCYNRQNRHNLRPSDFVYTEKTTRCPVCGKITRVISHMKQESYWRIAFLGQ